MQSKIEIYNLALGRLGVKPLVGETDRRHEADLCAMAYPVAVAEVLDMGNFACSIRRAELPKLAEAPAFGYAYAYALPADFLHLAALENEREPYVIENGALLTDAARCRMIYVGTVNDLSKFPVHVVNCIVVRLAAKLATALTNNLKLAQAFLSEFEQIALPAAMAVDNFQRYRDPGSPYWGGLQHGRHQ